MPKHCCVKGCSNRQSAKLNLEHGITFHMFPNQRFTGRRQQWMENVGIEKENVRITTRICSVHFEEKMFDRYGQHTRLIQNAVPTLFEMNKQNVKMSSIEELLKNELGFKRVKSTGKSGGGCISEGSAYETDQGTVFVKYNSKSEAFQMFEGEYESLVALTTAGQVKVPNPIKVLKNPKGGAMLIMECIEMQGLSLHAAKLGEQMARLHLHNVELKNKAVSRQQSLHGKANYTSYISQFGFPIPTCCGYLPQDNNWMDNWVDFFARKIEQHVKIAEEKYNDRDARQEWSTLLPHLPKLFQALDIYPSLLHGDLWGGNAAENAAGPVIFDPASFYGHSEYDLAISKMFGGFGKSYFSSYHNVIPKQAGFNERQDLYMMFHYFNHWNHFGGGYKSSTLRLLNALNKQFSY